MSTSKDIQPPYYAVVFTSVRTEGENGYGEAATRMVKLAMKQPGFIGFDVAGEKVGIFISYWTDLDAIKAWKENAEHRATQGRAVEWYSKFRVRICRVEKEYGR